MQRVYKREDNSYLPDACIVVNSAAYKIKQSKMCQQRNTLESQ